MPHRKAIGQSWEAFSAVTISHYIFKILPINSWSQISLVSPHRHSHQNSVVAIAEMAMEMAIRASATSRPRQLSPSSLSDPKSFLKTHFRPSRVSLPASTTIPLLGLFSTFNEAKALSLSKEQIVSSLTEVSAYKAIKCLWLSQNSRCYFLSAFNFQRSCCYEAKIRNFLSWCFRINGKFAF